MRSSLLGPRKADPETDPTIGARVSGPEKGGLESGACGAERRKRGARIGPPVSPSAPKDSGVYGIGKARDGELARGSSGPEKRLGRTNAAPKRRSERAAIREFTSSPPGRFSSAVMLVEAWRGVVWPRDAPSVSRLLSLAALTTRGRPSRRSGAILAGVQPFELETVAPPARNGRSSPPIFYEGELDQVARERAPKEDWVAGAARPDTSSVQAGGVARDVDRGVRFAGETGPRQFALERKGGVFPRDDPLVRT